MAKIGSQQYTITLKDSIDSANSVEFYVESLVYDNEQENSQVMSDLKLMYESEFPDKVVDVKP